MRETNRKRKRDRETERGRERQRQREEIVVNNVLQSSDREEAKSIYGTQFVTLKDICFS